MNLQGYRKKKKLTQDELAKEVGVSQAYICALEKGQKNNPSVRVLISIAKAIASRATRTANTGAGATRR